MFLNNKSTYFCNKVEYSIEKYIDGTGTRHEKRSPPPVIVLTEENNTVTETIHIKLIANWWAWGRCLWKLVVVPSKIRASSRAHRYPWQPRERQPPPDTVTLRNSVEILTNLYTYHGQPRGREEEGQTAALMHKYELEIARPQSEYI